MQPEWDFDELISCAFGAFFVPVLVPIILHFVSAASSSYWLYAQYPIYLVVEYPFVFAYHPAVRVGYVLGFMIGAVLVSDWIGIVVTLALAIFAYAWKESHALPPLRYPSSYDDVYALIMWGYVHETEAITWQEVEAQRTNTTIQS